MNIPIKNYELNLETGALTELGEWLNGHLNETELNLIRNRGMSNLLWKGRFDFTYSDLGEGKVGIDISFTSKLALSEIAFVPRAEDHEAGRNRYRV